MHLSSETQIPGLTSLTGLPVRRLALGIQPTIWAFISQFLFFFFLQMAISPVPGLWGLPQGPIMMSQNLPVMWTLLDSRGNQATDVSGRCEYNVFCLLSIMPFILRVYKIERRWQERTTGCCVGVSFSCVASFQPRSTKSKTVQIEHVFPSDYCRKILCEGMNREYIQQFLSII